MRTPSGPPASPASRASQAPHSTAATPAYPAVRPRDQGSASPATAARAVNQPTVTPATTGTTPAAQCSGVPAPAPGTAASSGTGGSSGAGSEDSGPVTCPAPSTNPGPRAYAAPHTAAFGTSARHSSSTANRPDHPSVSCANAIRAAGPCHTSEAATSRAPPPTSTAAPAVAARAQAPRRLRVRAPGRARRSGPPPVQHAGHRPVRPPVRRPHPGAGRAQGDERQAQRRPAPVRPQHAPRRVRGGPAPDGEVAEHHPGPGGPPRHQGCRTLRRVGPVHRVAGRPVQQPHRQQEQQHGGESHRRGGAPESVSVRTSSAPCASSHSAAATCSAPPGPLSGYGELIHSVITSTAKVPSPSPAATTPPRRLAASPGDRRRIRVSREFNGDRRSVIRITTAMLPTTRAFPA
ncbi:hypothetical protein GCM10020295_31320 [Streptomyces cinereospinus]